MRRLVLILLAVGLAAPAVALAVKNLPGDGSLAVENARGVIVLNVRGGIIGRMDSGTLEITDPIVGDGPPYRVRGYQQKFQLGPRHWQYQGDGDIRFRLIGGLYRVTVAGQGIDLSIVGKGTVVLDGSGFTGEQPGRFSINGGAYQPMPDGAKRYALGASTAAQAQDRSDEKAPQGPGSRGQ
jgi:hypothetical protein